MGSYSADFVHHDPLTTISTSDNTDCHRHLEVKRKLYSALAESDEGELAISIPKQVSLKTSGHTATGLIISEGRESLCHLFISCLMGRRSCHA